MKVQHPPRVPPAARSPTHLNGTGMPPRPPPPPPPSATAVATATTTTTRAAAKQATTNSSSSEYERPSADGEEDDEEVATVAGVDLTAATAAAVAEIVGEQPQLHDVDRTTATDPRSSNDIEIQQLLPSDVRLVHSHSGTGGPGGGGISSAVARAPPPPPLALGRQDSAQSISSTTTPTAGDRASSSVRRGLSSRGKPPTDERTGFARIYFENQSFTSSTVFKLTATTTVLEVRKSMANKIKIPVAEFAYYVIVVVYPSDSNARSLSGRTLQDDELILPIVDKLNRVRSTVVETDDSPGPLRPKAKHRTRPPLKFILKDVRGSPLDLEEEYTRKESSESPGLVFPAFLGKGVRSGYLQKASVKDPNVWRRRWFVIKDDQLLYCKSATNQRDVTTISLLSAYLAKARPEVKVPFSFELRTPRRTYQLCANSKEDMVAWIHALHVQIGISSENHRLYEAEIIITEDAVTRNEEEEAVSSPLSEPSLLQRVLAREDLLKLFRDYAYSIGAQNLLDTWIECELFRRNCIERENGLVGANSKGLKRSAKDEWEHLKSIVRATEGLPLIHSDEVAQLRQSFQSEQLSRRLSIALHSDASSEHPRVELIASIHQRIFEAIESGPFKMFLIRNGYRLLLERVMGRIV